MSAGVAECVRKCGLRRYLRHEQQPDGEQKCGGGGRGRGRGRGAGGRGGAAALSLVHDAVSLNTDTNARQEKEKRRQHISDDNNHAEEPKPEAGLEAQRQHYQGTHCASHTH